MSVYASCRRALKGWAWGVVVAIFHFSAKVISRAKGSSAVAAAAYRSASRLHNERLDRLHDFTSKAGVVHSEILAPDGTPARWLDREVLWNEVEAGEKRKDAQLAREVEFAVPREMSQAEGIALARDFVRREFVDLGMVADLNVHWDIGEDGSCRPHAHVMLTMRAACAEGFGLKVREWNLPALLEHWRAAWGEHVNERLASLDKDMCVDHRSLKDQGIALEPLHTIGPPSARRQQRSGGASERLEDHLQIARRNGQRIIADPDLALSVITHQQSTFTHHDLVGFIHRCSYDKDQFDQAMSSVRLSPSFIALGRDDQGRERFTSREMLGVELRLEQSAANIADQRRHAAAPEAVKHAMAADITLSDEQLTALSHVLAGRDLALVVGYAGSGKSTLLGVARQAWEAEGYAVRGAALSGIAAESLEHGSKIASRTLASLEHAWGNGRELLTDREVLVIDEAGMVGSRQMQRVLDQVERAGAKVVLVGDPGQLQAIEAGAAFRALAERHGAMEITQMRRQSQDWQREATRELATGRTAAALERYEQAGMVMAHETAEAAREALVEVWAAQRERSPGVSQLMMAYTRADVAALNGLARERLRAAGELGADQAVMTERGTMDFAIGDRLMFLRNERSLGVKNGTLGTVETVNLGAMLVRLDDGRRVAFDLKDYAELDHGYAATIHKAQGVTVERTHVLASGHMDRHAAYVALTRHRDGVALHYSRGEFATRVDLARMLGRERGKDMTLDYLDRFAERRGVTSVTSEIERPTPARSQHFRHRAQKERTRGLGR